MKMAIVGSRTFNEYETLRATLEPYKDKITEIVSGGARGADTLGERWAKEHNKKITIFYPDWDTHGKAAGFIRNKDIVENSDGVVAFWDGKSKGTVHSMKLAEKLDKPLKVVGF